MIHGEFKKGESLALVKCIECGQQVSDRASFCPSCGNPDIGSVENDAPPSPPPVPVSLVPKQEHLEKNGAQTSKQPADSLTGLQFKQTRSQRNKPRSIWPKLVLVAMVVGVGFGLYKYYPAIMSTLAGKPSASKVEGLLEGPLAGSLTVNDYKVPAKFVDIIEVRVNSLETYDKRGDVVLYRAAGDAVARLKASGQDIGKDVEGQIGLNAQRLNRRAAIEAVYSRFQAHGAMANVPAGTEYPLSFEVVVRVVDGNPVLVDGRITSNN